MKNTLTLQPGSPMPYGSTVTPEGINFALFSRHAETVTLVVASGRRPDWVEFPLDPARHRTGDVWHALLVGAPDEVRKQLEELIEQTGADELILTAQTFDQAARLRSFELIAKAWGMAETETTGLGATT